MIFPLLLLGGGVLVVMYLLDRSKAMSPAVPSGGVLNADGSWTPPDPPGLYDDPVVATDPRIPPTGVPLGDGLPCPGNPAPPVGWSYWTTQPVTANLSAWAVQMRNQYPIGSFFMSWIDGQLVGARIEYHSEVGATGAQGCYKGLNLLVPNFQPQP